MHMNIITKKALISTAATALFVLGLMVASPSQAKANYNGCNCSYYGNRSVGTYQNTYGNNFNTPLAWYYYNNQSYDRPGYLPVDNGSYYKYSSYQGYGDAYSNYGSNYGSSYGSYGDYGSSYGYDNGYGSYDNSGYGSYDNYGGSNSGFGLSANFSYGY